MSRKEGAGAFFPGLSEPPVGKLRVDDVRGLLKFCDSVILVVVLLSEVKTTVELFIDSASLKWSKIL